jgi:hypothetical protein
MMRLDFFHANFQQSKFQTTQFLPDLSVMNELNFDELAEVAI